MITESKAQSENPSSEKYALLAKSVITVNSFSIGPISALIIDRGISIRELEQSTQSTIGYIFLMSRMVSPSIVISEVSILKPISLSLLRV